MDSHGEEDLFQEAYDEAFDLRGLKEEQRRKAVTIPYTQQEEIQKTTEKRRRRSKGASMGDNTDNGEVVELLMPDSQLITPRRTRTAIERRLTKKANKTIQEKEESFLYTMLIWMKKAII